jgi:hypothetical protein
MRRLPGFSMLPATTPRYHRHPFEPHRPACYRSNNLRSDRGSFSSRRDWRGQGRANPICDSLLKAGAVVFLQMTTWKKGRYLLRKNSQQMLSLTDLIISTTALAESGLPCRVPGTAVFLSAQPKGHHSAQHQAQPRSAPAQYCAHNRDRPHTVRPKKRAR